MLSRIHRVPELIAILRQEATSFVKLRVASVLLLVLIAAALSAFGPVALKLIVDSVATHGERSAGLPLLLLAIYVATQWLARAATEIRELVYGRILRRMSRTLSERLFAHLMHLPLRFHLNRSTGAVSEALTSGLEGFQLLLHHLVFTILPVVAQLAIVMVILADSAPLPFVMFFCVALLCYSGAFGYSAATLATPARAASAARVDAGATITDGLLNYETVKYFTAESIVQERVALALARTESEWLVFSRTFARNGLAVATIFAAFVAVTAAYATIDVLHARMTIGEFVLINTYMLQLAQPIETLGSAIQGFSQGFGMLDKMLDLLEEPPEPILSHLAENPRGPGNLQFDHVSLSYRQDHPVLRDISFRIAPQHTLAIVGPSGAGKSTIVRLLMRLLEPDSGQILLDCKPIAEMTLLALRSAIAIVPQDTVLFNDTLGYNIALGRPGSRLRDVQRAAQVACVHDFIMNLPDGYDTRVGERGIKLSGGERQRISIARAVLKSPRLYVFDEATSSLDSQTERDILGSMRAIAAQSSTLVIAHRLSTVVHADEILVLEDGRVTESGGHPQLLRRNGRYAALWRAQQSGVAAA